MRRPWKDQPRQRLDRAAPDDERAYTGAHAGEGLQGEDDAAADARAARERMLIGSSIKVASIVEWDGAKIGDGRPGGIAKALLARLEEDMRTGRDRLTDVPY